MEAAVAAGKPLWDVLSHATRMPTICRPRPPRARRAVRALDRAVTPAAAASRSLVDVARELIDADRLSATSCERLYTDPNEQQSRWTAVEEVVNALGAYEKRAKQPTLAGFLDEVALGDREDDDDKDKQLARTPWP